MTTTASEAVAAATRLVSPTKGRFYQHPNYRFNGYYFERGEFGRPCVTDQHEEHQSICLDCEFGANASNDWGLCANHRRERRARKARVPA